VVCCIGSRKRQVGFGPEIEIERGVLGYGTPRGMAVGAMGGGGRMLHTKVVVVWWSRVGSRQAGRRGSAKSFEIEPPRVGSGVSLETAIEEMGRWWVWRVRVVDVVTPCWVTSGNVGLGHITQNQPSG